MKISAAIAAVGAFAAVQAAPLHHLADQVRGNFEDQRVLTISEDHLTEETITLLQSHGADHFGKNHFKLNPEAVEDISSSSIEFVDTTEDWIKHFEANFRSENFFCDGSAEECASRSLDDYYSSYQSLDSLVARARSKIEGVPFARMFTLGKSYEGRDQTAVEIGDQSLPLVFYWCNIHAREWLTPHACTYMIETLVADGGHPILDTYSFTVVISANPDGYEFSREVNNMWRKTRRPNTDVGNTRCYGTDPNRNWDFYHCGAGTSNNPCSDVYCGPRPFSEIEVANLRDYATTHKNRLIAANDVHAYGYYWMFAYGAISQDTPDYDKQNTCALQAVQAIQELSGGRLWKYGPIYSTIYPAAGSSVDYLYVELDVIYAMTAEVRGNSFQPNPSNILPSNIEIFTAMLASLKCIGETEGLEVSEFPAPPALPNNVVDADCDFFFC